MASDTDTSTQLDPALYEIFLHRLWAIGEEGRITLQRVSASPIVVQGGECMSSFYDRSGAMVLACSGHLRFAAATSQAIRFLVQRYGDDPGIHDGDQLFLNDPYVAGSHTYDQMVIKPMFFGGELIGWTASSSHTADTGGLLRGGATEIYHEGVRVSGLKVVEGGKFRLDVFDSLIKQCRDEHYVGLDLKSRIAANNVCAARYLELVERFGAEFCAAAFAKILDDSDRLARAKLRALPDGRWRSRTYYTVMDRATRKVKPIRVSCEVTKVGDQLTIDLDGTSPQQSNDQNSTLPSTIAHVAIALTNQLFWDVPWSDGKLNPVEIKVPKGSILNCEFPAACGFAPRVGQQLVAAVSECLAKMLYAGGFMDDVNATWQGRWYEGGPGYFFGGHDRRGLPNPQGIYDIHGSGLGATPTRDGVDSGGHMNIPSGGISDVERVELQYPFLNLGRNHNRDGGGYGRYVGGLGTARLSQIYESLDFTVDYKPYGGLPQGFGLFGGYPAGTGGLRAILEPTDGMGADYPTNGLQAVQDGAARIFHPGDRTPRVDGADGWWISDFTPGGGGFGDPLHRPADVVAKDVHRRRLSDDVAQRVFGVVLFDGELDVDATRMKREEIIAERLGCSSVDPSPSSSNEVVPDGQVLARHHEYLEVVAGAEGPMTRCVECNHVFGAAHKNYKATALRRTRPMAEFAGRPLPSGDDYLGEYHEYFCPGCGVQLEVDVYCPELDVPEPVWDILLHVAEAKQV